MWNADGVRRGVWRAAAAVAVVLMAGAGCDADGGEQLSLAGLTGTADAVPEDGADSCPLPYGIAEAAKAAGLDGKAGAGPAGGGEDPVATGEGGGRAEAGDPLAENPGALVSCVFHVGRHDVWVHTVATRDRNAVNVLTPVVARLGELSTDDAIGFVGKSGRAGAGEVVVAPSGNIAAVRLELDGDGDAALLVGVGEPGAPGVDAGRTRGLTEALAEQVR